MKDERERLKDEKEMREEETRLRREAEARVRNDCHGERVAPSETIDDRNISKEITRVVRREVAAAAALTSGGASGGTRVVGPNFRHVPPMLVYIHAAAKYVLIRAI